MPNEIGDKRLEIADGQSAMSSPLINVNTSPGEKIRRGRRARPRHFELSSRYFVSQGMNHQGTKNTKFLCFVSDLKIASCL